METKSSGQRAPMPSATQKVPRLVRITPTPYLRLFSGTRASGLRTIRPAAATTTAAAIPPTIPAGKPRPGPPSGQAHRKHDGQGLDRLDGRAEECCAEYEELLAHPRKEIMNLDGRRPLSRRVDHATCEQGERAVARRRPGFVDAARPSEGRR